MNKLTDAEIVKALECCGNSDSNCIYCPYLGETYCVHKDAIDIINRQKAEIEELRKGFTADMDYFASEYDSKIKAEAIKEFIKEHREVMMAFCDDDDQISLKVCEYDANTDNLVKEMVGDNDV